MIALVVILNIFLSLRFSAIGNDLINEKLVANTNSLKLYLNDSEVNSKVAAASMALNSDIVKAVKQRDTQELLRLFNPMHDIYRINYYTITDINGIVLARTYDPENFGDSILNQQNVKDALDGKVSSFFETGTVVKVAIRTGVPVYDADGTIIGMISAGVRFDTQNAVENLKKLFNSEVTVFLGNTRIVTTIVMGGNSIAGTTLDPHIEEIVLVNKQEYLGDVDIFGEKYKTFYMPLLNAQNEAFAAIVLGIPVADLIAASNKSIRDGIILGLGGLAASILLLFIIISSISKPITRLASDMHQIASGNLHIAINVKSEDEVGLLGRSLQKVANILHKMLEDINNMISEHEKGNVDYCLDTDAFLGDYNRLAKSVVELSAVGMLDQLTGIPNRRSFDNRLELEWSRAIREKTPISFLILDVDKFKSYNDTFGHQQGDVTLQTIAKTIKQSVKRLIDFAARWGGEEFVVLLPATDSTGAFRVAEMIRKAIENTEVPCSDPGGRKVTVSIGVCTQIPEQDSSVSDFIAAADTALYKAKEAGRNRVVLSG